MDPKQLAKIKRQLQKIFKTEKSVTISTLENTHIKIIAHRFFGAHIDNVSTLAKENNLLYYITTFQNQLYLMLFEP